MNHFKHIMTVLALFAVTGMTAQKMNKQVSNEVMTKNYAINHGNKTIDYSIKIDTKETGYVTMDKAELTKKEQTRIDNNKKVTKIISIDNDADPIFDNVIALTYLTQDDEHFKINQTKNGFDIDITGKKLRYNFIKKEYDIIKKDGDTFEVVVMKTK